MQWTQDTSKWATEDIMLGLKKRSNNPQAGDDSAGLRVALPKHNSTRRFLLRASEPLCFFSLHDLLIEVWSQSGLESISFGPGGVEV